MMCTTSQGQDCLMGGRECLSYMLRATEGLTSLLIQLLGLPGHLARLGVRNSPGLDIHTQNLIPEVEESLVGCQLDLKRWKHWVE